MFGFEIRCIHKSRLYSEWAVVSPGKRGLPRYRRTWIREHT